MDQKAIRVLLPKREKTLGSQKTETYTRATHSNIPKTLHRPNETGFWLKVA